jgi:hypothetical protein
MPGCYYLILHEVAPWMLSPKIGHRAWQQINYCSANALFVAEFLHGLYPARAFERPQPDRSRGSSHTEAVEVSPFTGRFVNVVALCTGRAEAWTR